MTAAEFLAEFNASTIRARDKHQRWRDRAAMSRALEAVLAYCEGNQDVPAAGVERVIESALAENGEEK